MQTIKKTIKLNKKDYYVKHLLLINNILPVQISNKQAEVLGCFMEIEGNIDPFSTSGRKIVRDNLAISSGGLGNHLDELCRKGFIIKHKETYKILPILIPDKQNQTYQFTLQNEI